MKNCIKCKHTKELNQFSKRARNKDNHENVCKECKHTYEQTYYHYAPNEMKTKRRALSKKRKLLTIEALNKFLITQ